MFISEKKAEYENINRKLVDVCGANEKKIVNRYYRVELLSYNDLGNILLTIGNIHITNEEEGVYVATINGGVMKKNYATVVIELQDEKIRIAVYADEGIINQHTSEGVINEFERYINKYIRK